MAESLFARIVCGVDGTPASMDGVRRAAELAEEGSTLVLVSVVDEASIAAATAGAAGVVMPPAGLDLGKESLDEAADLVRADWPGLRVETHVVEGPVLPTLLGALEDAKATVAVAGRHGHSRLAGLVLGSAVTTLLHEAPCSVLVAGPCEGPFPRSIVVGYDGSEQAARAVHEAVEIAHRVDASLDAVCATDGKEVPLDRLQSSLTEIAPGTMLSVEDADPVHALVSAKADLVVVGSRGLHGMKALGSVSERVAHKADCSVLVVR